MLRLGQGGAHLRAVLAKGLDPKDDLVQDHGIGVHIAGRQGNILADHLWWRCQADALRPLLPQRSPCTPHLLQPLVGLYNRIALWPGSDAPFWRLESQQEAMPTAVMCLETGQTAMQG